MKFISRLSFPSHYQGWVNLDLKSLKLSPQHSVDEVVSTQAVLQVSQIPVVRLLRFMSPVKADTLLRPYYVL